jgi:transcriptional repressor NrdR
MISIYYNRGITIGGKPMKCPFCEYLESKVIDSRPTDEGQAIRRRRECMRCSRRFTTYEKIEEIPIIIVKKDGNRQAYDRNKLLNGILKSCEKRPVPMSVIEQIVDDIERNLSNSLEKEITSVSIGELVMNKLKNVDEVAYVRFASVYRQFKDVNSFMEELKKILDEGHN